MSTTDLLDPAATSDTPSTASASNDLLEPARQQPPVPQHQLDLLAPEPAAAEVGVSAAAETAQPATPNGFAYPTEYGEDVEQLTRASSPFSPYSPEFQLDLREEDVTDFAGPVPGMKGPIGGLHLSPPEQQAEVNRLIELEAEAVAQSGPLLLEFGPMADLERRLRSIIADFASPELAHVVTTHMRRHIHDVVVTNTLLSAKETTEDGLAARTEAVGDILDRYTSHVVPVLARIEAGGADLSTLKEAISNTMEVEERRLKMKEGKLVPATLGTFLFEGLQDIKAALTGGPKPVVGDVRRARNEQLSRQLSDLVELSFEMQARSGDADWEKAEGVMAMKAARDLTFGIQELTKGVEDQVDYTILNKGLSDANANIQNAMDNAATDDHKNGLKQLSELIKLAMAGITKALRRVFGTANDTGHGPASPTP